MVRLVALVLLAALAVAEVAAVMALVDALGPGMALLLLGADMVLGILIMRWGARSRPPQRAWRMAAGAFVALPGFVLDVVGFALLVPAVQRFIRDRLARGTESLLRRQGVVIDDSGRPAPQPGDVIPGQVVDDGPEQTPTDRAPGSGPGPRVVRGEIAGDS